MVFRCQWPAELLKAPVEVQKISDCTAVACGAEFSIWLCDGKMWSAGGSQYGQLGHGTDHEYNAKDCKSLRASLLGSPALYQLHWKEHLQQCKPDCLPDVGCSALQKACALALIFWR